MWLSVALKEAFKPGAVAHPIPALRKLKYKAPKFEANLSYNSERVRNSIRRRKKQGLKFSKLLSSRMLEWTNCLRLQLSGSDLQSVLGRWISG